MEKRSRFLSVLCISLVLILTSIDLISFAAQNNNQNRIELTQYFIKDGNLVVEGNTSVDMLKVLIRKDGKDSWGSVDLANGRFSKTVFINQGLGLYDVFLMLHEGNYEFSYGPHFQLNVMAPSTSNAPKTDSGSAQANNSGNNSSSAASNASRNIPSSAAPNQSSAPSSAAPSQSSAASTPAPSQNYTGSADDYASLARQITAGANTDYEKAKRIYDWVSKNISYDMTKYRRMLKNDFSGEFGAATALIHKKGVCYDYASLVVALGKAAGLQAKLIKGDYILSNGKREYHAWNEVYSKETGSWIKFDTTFASVYLRDYFNNAGFEQNHEKHEEEA